MLTLSLRATRRVDAHNVQNILALSHVALNDRELYHDDHGWVLEVSNAVLTDVVSLGLCLKATTPIYDVLSWALVESSELCVEVQMLVRVRSGGY